MTPGPTPIAPSPYSNTTAYPDQFGSDTLDLLDVRNPATVSDLIDDNVIGANGSYEPGKSHNY